MTDLDLDALEAAKAMREQLGNDYPKRGSILDLWFRTADALESTTARLREAEAEAARLRAVMGRGFEKTLEDRDEAYREMHARELHHFEAEQLLSEAEATIDAVRANLSNAPECDEHPDDGPITCGWKSDMIRVRAAIARHQDKRENGRRD